MSKKKVLEIRIQEESKEGHITCSLLRKIAEETGTSYKSAGKTANQLKIKINNCDLGCF